jgi:uroporphyrinogen-III synthase
MTDVATQPTQAPQPAQAAPLAGRAIGVTRPAERAASLVATLEALGAAVVACPAIAVQAPASYTALDDALARLADFDWIAVTSVAAVAAVADRLRAAGHDPIATLGTGPRVAVVGEATAAAARAQLGRCDLVPPSQTADGLAAAFPRPFRTRVLFPCADRARDAFPAGMRARGALVESVVAYCTVLDAHALGDLAQRAAAGTLDAVLLASPSAADALASALGRIGAPVPRLVCIGPATAARCRDLGFDVAAVASSPNDDALAVAARAVLDPLR